MTQEGPGEVAEVRLSDLATVKFWNFILRVKDAIVTFEARECYG